MPGESENKDSAQKSVPSSGRFASGREGKGTDNSDFNRGGYCMVEVPQERQAGLEPQHHRIRERQDTVSTEPAVQ